MKQPLNISASNSNLGRLVTENTFYILLKRTSLGYVSTSSGTLIACTILTGHLMSMGLEKSISNLAVFSQKSRRMIPTPPYLGSMM
jgi:hypothetical protein